MWLDGLVNWIERLWRQWRKYQKFFLCLRFLHLITYRVVFFFIIKLNELFVYFEWKTCSSFYQFLKNFEIFSYTDGKRFTTDQMKIMIKRIYCAFCYLFAFCFSYFTVYSLMNTELEITLRFRPHCIYIVDINPWNKKNTLKSRQVLLSPPTCFICLQRANLVFHQFCKNLVFFKFWTYISWLKLNLLPNVLESMIAHCAMYTHTQFWLASS